MSLKDKLELGLVPDAPYRPDNLPPHQKDHPAAEVAASPGETAEIEAARDALDGPGPEPGPEDDPTVRSRLIKPFGTTDDPRKARGRKRTQT